MIKPGRIPCCIPHCGRTADERKYGAGAEIICPVHWRMVPKRLRLLYRKVERRYNDEVAKYTPGDTPHWALVKYYEQGERLWGKIKKAVMP